MLARPEDQGAPSGAVREPGRAADRHSAVRRCARRRDLVRDAGRRPRHGRSPNRGGDVRRRWLRAGRAARHPRRAARAAAPPGATAAAPVPPSGRRVAVVTGVRGLSGRRLAPTATPKTLVPVLGSAELAVAGSKEAVTRYTRARLVLHITDGRVIRDTIDHAWNVTASGEIVDSTLDPHLRAAAGQAGLEYEPGDPADSWPASIPDAAGAMAEAARSQTRGRRPHDRRRIVEAFGQMFRTLRG
jgi:hypothetical protein